MGSTEIVGPHVKLVVLIKHIQIAESWFVGPNGCNRRITIRTLKNRLWEIL